MNLYCLFALPLVFFIWFAYERKKHERLDKKQQDNFWELDAKANEVRKKNLDTIEYISIPMNSFPIGTIDDSIIHECEDKLLSLSSKRILNLTGKTSTDLKLMYGAANLNTVSEYDDNYTSMVQTIYTYGERLYSLGRVNEAITVLEFGINSLSDIKGNYKLLSQLYIDTCMPERIDYLISSAEKLDSLSKTSILRNLRLIKDAHIEE